MVDRRLPCLKNNFFKKNVMEDIPSTDDRLSRYRQFREVRSDEFPQTFLEDIPCTDDVLSEKDNSEYIIGLDPYILNSFYYLDLI